MDAADFAELARFSPPPFGWFDDEDFSDLFGDEPHEIEGGPQREGIGRRKFRADEEYDVHTSWRKILKWSRRAGNTSGVKRRTRRRERREAKRVIV